MNPDPIGAPGVTPGPSQNLSRGPQGSLLRGCGWMLLGSFLTVAIQVVGCVTFARKAADVLTPASAERPGSAPNFYQSDEDARADQRRMNREREEARDEGP